MVESRNLIMHCVTAQICSSEEEYHLLIGIRSSALSRSMNRRDGMLDASIRCIFVSGY